jgi:DNA-binding response OmpR family regulator
MRVTWRQAEEARPTLVRPIRPSAARQRVLLVEPDAATTRLLRVALGGAGWEVTTAATADEALAAHQTGDLDLVICDVSVPQGDGVADGLGLCRRLQQGPPGAKVPVIVLTARPSVETRLRAVELGIEDCLGKPVYVSELLARAQALLRRSVRERLEAPPASTTSVAGRLSEVGVIDLLQTMEVNRRSGIIHLGTRDWGRAAVTFREGRPVNAEAGRLRGREALYRLLSWDDGFFEVELRPVRGRDLVERTVPALLAEGILRLEERTRLLAQLPPLDTVFVVSFRELVNRVGELPDEVGDLIRLFDGWRTMVEVIDDCDLPDLGALRIISRLHDERLFAEGQRELAPPDEADTLRLPSPPPPAPGPPSPAPPPPAPPPVTAEADSDPAAALQGARRRLILRVGASAATVILAALVITAAAGRRSRGEHRAPVAAAPVVRPAPVLAQPPAPPLAVPQPPPAPTAVAVPAPVPVPGPDRESLRAACHEADDDGRGKYRAVMAACQAAVDADPGAVDVMLILAAAEANRGHDRQALGWAEKALAVDPAAPDAYVFLGNGQQAAGRQGDARAAYQKYLELAPQGKYAADLRAVLRSF